MSVTYTKRMLTSFIIIKRTERHFYRSESNRLFLKLEFCSLNIQRGWWDFQFAAGTFYVKNVDSRQYFGWNCTGYRFN